MEEAAELLEKIQGTTDEQVQSSLSLDEVHSLSVIAKEIFRRTLLAAGVSDEVIRQISTKFHDAGPRSPPWQKGSERGAFRSPQDGSDGNRQNRWLFPADHKFYASEHMGWLIEVRFYFQTLAMEGAPELPSDVLVEPARILLGHELRPGAFKDPITKLPVAFSAFVADRRAIESGHIVPLGRMDVGIRGRHTIENATLMLRDSNRIQADKTVPELMAFFRGVLERHGFAVNPPETEEE